MQADDPLKYDVLIADAFSSDAIPMHLLTLESMEIYKQRLKPDGILAFHVSNRYLYLENVVKLLAEELGLQATVVDDEPDDEFTYSRSTWVLVTTNSGFIDYIKDEDFIGVWPEKKYTARWTDDFSSIIPVMRWEKESTWLKDLIKEKGLFNKDKKKKSDSE